MNITSTTEVSGAGFSLEQLFREYEAFANAVQVEFVDKMFGRAPTVEADGTVTQRDFRPQPAADSYLWHGLEDMYDYGIRGHASGAWDLGARDLPPDSAAADATMLFLYGTPIAAPYMEDNNIPNPALVERTVRTALARHLLDGGERYAHDRNQPKNLLQLDEVALLANLDTRSVRNAAISTKSGPGRLVTVKVGAFTFVEPETALSWLLTRPGFIPTKQVHRIADFDYMTRDFLSTDQALNFLEASLLQSLGESPESKDAIGAKIKEVKHLIADPLGGFPLEALQALSMQTNLDVDQYIRRIRIAFYEGAIRNLKASS